MESIIEKHPICVYFKELKMYLEEPGDPVWESKRTKLLMELHLMEQLVYTEIYKVESFDNLKRVYDNNPDLLTKKSKVEKLSILLKTMFNYD